MLRALLFVPVRSLGNYVAFNRVEAELEKGRGKRRWILAGWLTGRWTDERTNETESGFASSSALSPPPVNHCRVAAADGSWKEGRRGAGWPLADRERKDRLGHVCSGHGGKS